MRHKLDFRILNDMFGVICLLVFIASCSQTEVSEKEARQVQAKTAEACAIDSIIPPEVIKINKKLLPQFQPGKNGISFPTEIKAGSPIIKPNRGIRGIKPGYSNLPQTKEQTIKVVPFVKSKLPLTIKPGDQAIPAEMEYGFIKQHSKAIIPPRMFKPGTDTLKLPVRIKVLSEASFNQINPITGETIEPPVFKWQTVPFTIPAMAPVYKDNPTANLKYLDVNQGMISSYILAMLEDKFGNLWFGTDGGGVSCYDGETFRHFTTEQGLSDNRVWSILEDRKGNIWFGTEGGGVSRYDGKAFTHFTTKQGLGNNIVWSILEDKSGNLWFGTQGGGVSRYDGETFTLFTTAQGLSNNSVLSMMEDKNGNIWLGTSGGGVSRYNGETFAHFTTEQGLNNNYIYSILEDKNGNIWFGTSGGGITCYNGVSFTHFTTQQGLCSDLVLSILEDKNGILWIGTRGGGVSCYDGEAFTTFTTEQGLNNNLIWSILEDKNGNIWFGTSGGGVSRYDGEVFTHFTREQGISNYVVFSILEDKNENIWFGTLGGGLSRFNGETFAHFTTEQGLSNNTVHTILEDKNSNLWFGTNGGGVTQYDGKTFKHFTTKQGLSNNEVWSILEDKKGILWFGTYGGGVSRFDGETFTHFTTAQGLSNNFVVSIVEDKSGNLWFGTDGGASRYDGETFTNFTTSQGLSSNNPRNFYEDKYGNMWIGTINKITIFLQDSIQKRETAYAPGLSVLSAYSFPGEKGNYKQGIVYLSVDQGLSSNLVYNITEDSKGNLWIGTEKGPVRLSPANEDTENAVRIGSAYYSIKAYTTLDGFIGGDVYSIKSVAEDSKGNIWWGSGKMVTRYNPEFDVTDSIVPQIHLKNIRLFFKEVNWENGLSNPGLQKPSADTNHCQTGIKIDGISKWFPIPENLSLPYHQNHITFNYISINWKRPDKTLYHFMLQGLDKDWGPLTGKTEATFSNLPHGSYTFKVQALSSEGIWSEILEYRFEIRTPWWSTWWFRTLYIFTAILVLFGLYHWRISSLNKQKISLEQAVNEKTEALLRQNDEVQTLNEELTSTNEDLYKQREELESTLNSLNETQQQLIQAEKMASLGTLTAGVAHEINNPLNFLVGAQIGLENYFNEHGSLDKDNTDRLIGIISVGIERISGIVKGLNQFSRSNEQLDEDCDLHQIIDNCLLMLYNKFKNKAQLQKDFFNGQILVKGNVGKLHQVFVNILDNAIQAIEEDGKIKIQTLIIADRVQITIEDNGIGIAKQNLPRIADPFFTTKAPGQGTGLGLSITYSIIKDHKGELEFESEENKGTKVLVTLPIK
jgi:signal transduction histidine kinase/ligand-binding sensor domain-containing protein